MAYPCEITAGYDNGLWNPSMDEYDTDLLPCDIVELAEHMAERWMQLRGMIEKQEAKPK